MESLQEAIRLLQGNRATAARALLEQLVCDTPTDPQVWHYLGIAHAMEQVPHEAEHALRTALTHGSQSAFTHYNLGKVLADQGDFAQALYYYCASIQLKPDLAEAHNNIGLALAEIGQYDLAIDSYRKALEIRPDYHEAHNNLGAAETKLGHPQLAISHFLEAVRLRPDFADAYSNLGRAYANTCQLPLAVKSYEQALLLNPENTESLLDLGVSLLASGKPGLAMETFQHALRLKPDLAEAWEGMGSSYDMCQQFDEAIRCFKRALEIMPDHASIWNNLAGSLLNRGQLDQAITAYRNAVRHTPELYLASSNLLLTLNYLPTLTTLDVFVEHKQCGEVIAKAFQALPEIDRDRNPSKRLRLGYVSPDFKEHSVAYFTESVLLQHDSTTVEVFCYSNLQRPSSVTARLSQLADHWRNIHGRTDEDVANQIRADGIDILIDLAGHTAHNRLPIFARKPAPVQVTYLGYPNTTGLKTMDYRLTDLEADPIGQEAFHTEQLVRLPHGFLCYTPPPDAPEVTALPALTVGHVTFGSFNNLAKMTPEVIGLWARILKAVPGSRLVIKNKSMKDGPTRERYLALFRDAGIGAERLDLVAWIPEAAGHLGAYARVDIALDTFPYNGTTTTCEALWMGVPVITLAGDRHAARVGVSLLTRVGLTELVAPSPKEYVQRAVELAGDTERLVQLRAGMRERVKNSPLCDAQSFTRDLEAAYREMWREWCATTTASTTNR